MALKPGTKEFEDWRKKNFNLNVRVPQSAIDKLMAGKTPSNNIRKYAGTNDKVMREAMNRFYGKGWEKKAPGFKSGGSATKPGPVSPRIAENTKPKYGTNTKSARAIEGSNGYTKPKNSKKPLTPYEREYKKLTGKTPQQIAKNSPITSIGGRIGKNWDGSKLGSTGVKLPKSVMSYKKLNPQQKALVDSVILGMLPVGVGLNVGVRALAAVKGAVTATKFAKAVKLEQAASKTLALTGRGSQKALTGASKKLALEVGPKGKAIQMGRITAQQEARALANATKATANAATKRYNAAVAKNTANYKRGIITRSELKMYNDRARADKLRQLMDGARKAKGKK